MPRQCPPGNRSSTGAKRCGLAEQAVCVDARKAWLTQLVVPDSTTGPPLASSGATAGSFAKTTNRQSSSPLPSRLATDGEISDCMNCGKWEAERM